MAKPTKELPGAPVLQESVSDQPSVLAEKDSAAPNVAHITSTEGSEKHLANGDLSAEVKEVAGSSVADYSEIDVSGDSGPTQGLDPVITQRFTC